MSSSFIEKELRAKQRSWRRRHKRYRTDFPVKASLLGEEGYQEIEGRCGDIGHGGMGTVLNTKVAKGEVISLQFCLKNQSEAMVVRAIVRYHRGFVHGLEFLGLTAEQQSIIDAFCSGLAPVE